MKGNGLPCSRLSRMVALVVAIVLLSGPVAGAADIMKPKGLKFEKKFGPIQFQPEPLFNVKLPLTIADLPGQWKNANLKASVMVFFMDNTGKHIGYGLPEAGEDFTALPALENGGYTGTVNIPIPNAAGTITGKTCCVAVVFAELNQQFMYIGTSKGGTAPQSGACNDVGDYPLEPGSVIY